MTLLRAIVYFVWAGDEVKQRAVGTLLAKEAIDAVYNQRDTNIRRSVRWDCANIDATKHEACAYRFALWKKYRIDFNDDGTYTIVDGSSMGTDEFQLYSHHVDWISIMNHQVSDTVSPYSRYVVFSEGTLWDIEVANDKLIKMTVFVEYIRWQAQRKVVLESLLSAWERTQ